jgi:predicted alpha/beta superfamily hydrolase
MSAEREADRFLRFIRDELVPFVEVNYRADGFRLLCGQSSSSLFVCYSLLIQPDLFDGYILNSFGFSDNGLKLYTEQFFNRSRVDVERDIYAFITNAAPDPYDPDGVRTQNGLRLLDRIKQIASSKVHVCYRTYAGEGHAPYPGEHDGLRWIYATKRI